MTQQPGPIQRVRRQSIRTMVQTPSPEQPAVSTANYTPEVPTETTVSQLEQTSPAHKEIATAGKPKRTKLGWPIRDHLIKQCKQIALDEGKYDYEVLEAFIEEGLARRNQTSGLQEI
jgi:hypothetical protein